MMMFIDKVVEATVDEVGFGKHTPTLPIKDYWDYTSTKNGLPEAHPGINDWTTTIYRGIVPAKNLLHRDFALVGSLVRSQPPNSRLYPHLALVHREHRIHQ